QQKALLKDRGTIGVFGFGKETLSILAATLAICVSLGSMPVEAAIADDFQVTFGPIETVIPDGTDGLHYFPDGPIVLLQAEPLRALVVAEKQTELLEGANWRSIKRISTVLSPG